MKHRYAFVLWCGLLLAQGLRAQQAQSLPGRFGAWSAAAPAEKLTVASLPGAAQETAAVLVESGLAGITRRAYSSGTRQLILTLLQFRDPSGAYSACTFLRAPKMVSSDLSPCAARARDHGIFLSGSSLVDAAGISAASVSDLRELAAELNRTADKTPLPLIRSFLPLEGKIAGTERYVTGVASMRAAAAALARPELAAIAEKAGFASKAEAMLASYRRGRESAVLLLLEYPTPQVAGLQQKHLETALAAAGPHASSPIRRKGSLLSVVLPAASPATEQALLDGVRYETDLTWNEPSHTATDPPWIRVIIGTFVGTGIFLLAAVVFGIAFGGVRLLTKLFFPGKVFDRQDQMQILQLGLNSKPLDANDFYASWDPRR